MIVLYVSISLIVWVFLGILSYDIRKKKGYDGVLGLLFGFLFGIFALIHSAGLPDIITRKKLDQLNAKLSTDKIIQDKINNNLATKINNNNDNEVAEANKKKEFNYKHKWRCSNCGKMISEDTCPFCGNEIA